MGSDTICWENNVYHVVGFSPMIVLEGGGVETEGFSEYLH